MNAEETSRAAVIAEAKSWLGTPYHHRAKLKGVGVDCAQLVLAVYAACGLVDDFDTGEYAKDTHMHRSIEAYLGEVLRHAVEIDNADVEPGDLMLWRFGRVFSHGAILVAPGVVVHAHMKDGAVVMSDSEREVDLCRLPRRSFTLWPKANTNGR